jgi:hypothetical protein
VRGDVVCWCVIVEAVWVDGVMHEAAADGNGDDDVRTEYIALVRQQPQPRGVYYNLQSLNGSFGASTRGFLPDLH